MYEYIQMYGRYLKDILVPVPLDKIVFRTIDVIYDTLKAKGLSDDSSTVCTSSSARSSERLSAGVSSMSMC